jgi:hypothetical protein
MKKNKREESIAVIINIYMEISQRNSLCSYHYLKQGKMSLFFFFFFFLISSTKSENRRADQVLPGVGKGR